MGLGFKGRGFIFFLVKNRDMGFGVQSPRGGLNLISHSINSPAFTGTDTESCKIAKISLYKHLKFH